jgi:hypothetical protein
MCGFPIDLDNRGDLYLQNVGRFLNNAEVFIFIAVLKMAREGLV